MFFKLKVTNIFSYFNGKRLLVYNLYQIHKFIFYFKKKKKIRDNKGTFHSFHSKMGSIKVRNGMDLTKAEDIKNRWQEYTEELYKKKIFTTQIIMMV